MEISDMEQKDIYEYFSCFDRLGMALLVTDPVTNKVLFANNSMSRLQHGLASDPVGKACYEVYDGPSSRERCDFCPVPRLLDNPAQSVTWERYSGSMKKWLRNTDVIVDWRGERNLHIQHVVDITQQKQEEYALIQRKKQQELIAAITRDFTILQENVYQQIYGAFEKAGAFWGIDRIFLMQALPNAQEASIECVWYREAAFKPAFSQNGSAANLDSYPHKESAHDYVVCDDVSQDTRYKAMQDAGVSSFLAVTVWADGEMKRWLQIETCAEPLHFEEKHIHFFSVLGDVVSQVLIRANDMVKLKRAQQQARQFFELAPFSCILFNEEAEIINCNLLARQLYGFSTKDEFIDLFFDHCHEAELNNRRTRFVFIDHIRKAINTGTSTFNWTYCSNLNKEIPLEIVMTRIPCEEGYYIAMIAHDLTRELLEEQQCRKAKRQLQTLLDSTPLICSMWDEAFNMIDCNLEAVRLLELQDNSEYISQFDRLNPAVQPDGESSKEKARRLLKWAMHTGRENFEWEYRTKTGKPLPVETTLIRVKWDDEYRILAYSRDLRVLKAAEAKKRAAEQRTLLMLDTLPMATFLISRNHELVDCNRKAVSMLQAKCKKHLIHSFLEDFSPDFQFDGQPSKDKATMLIARAFEEGYVVSDWRHLAVNGDVIPAEIMLTHAYWKENEELICAYVQDLRDVKRTEEELRKKSILLETVNIIAKRLFSVDASAMEHELEASLGALAQSINADSAGIWQNVECDNSLCCRLQFAWPAGRDALAGAYEDYAGLAFWRDKISSNSIINGPVKNLPKAERRILQGSGVKSVLSIPLLIQNTVWGFVRFDDCQHARVFSESEEQALRSGCALLASALLRKATRKELIQKNEELEKRRNMLSMVNQVAEYILSSDGNDLQCAARTSLRIIGQGVLANCTSIWRNQPGNNGVVYATRIVDWREEGVPDTLVDTTALPLYEYIPEWQDEDFKRDLEFGHSDMNEKLRELACVQEGSMYHFLPLYLQESFWGFVEFAHLNSGGFFSKEERDIIRSGSLMIAGAIMQEHAEAAAQTKNQFLSNMSHEIRTPINAVIGMTDLLAREELNKQQHFYVDTIRSSSKLLLGIINDILDFSKIEAGRMEMVPVDFDFHCFLTALESFVTVLAQPKGISFRVILQECIPAILYADEVRLSQALLNILSNAVKFTHQGSVTLSICLDEKGYVCFDVADTGIGIKPGDIPMLFNRFAQLDMSKNRAASGSGLGLPIAKNIVELMGGDISLESKYGAGSIFHIRIPFVPGNPDNIKQKNDVQIFVHAPNAEVLVVDDKVANLHVAVGLLALSGITCDTAGSGEQAIDMIHKKKYDIVFMDHMMPGMDGEETTRILRKTYGSDELVIVALTANAIMGTREWLIQQGMNDYLPKPIDLALLNEVLMHWLPPEKMLKRSEPFPTNKAPGRYSGTLAKIRQIEGIDVDLGLDRLGGRLEIYESTLGILARRLPETERRLPEFLLEEDLPNFVVEVHGLKGSLNNIGAVHAAQLAEKLESASRHGDAEYCKTHLPELLSVVERLRKSLEEAFLESSNAAAFAERGDALALPAKLELARNALVAFERDAAMEILQDLCRYDYGAQANAVLNDATAAIELFDYNKALGCLDRLQTMKFV